jgi:hypothetical protein
LNARGDDNKHILDVALQEKQGHNIFDVVRSSRIAREHATMISQPSRDTRTQQSIFYMLLIATMTAMSIFLYDLLQEATTRMVDCNEGM